jgi:hypothetical protein
MADCGHPLPGAQPITFYLGSAGKANTLNGDAALAAAAPDADKPDAFTYDPLNPVLSYGAPSLHRHGGAGRRLRSRDGREDIRSTRARRSRKERK